ncbi:MAG: DUF4847 family protein [Bacteroides sp.]|nr:DUF4847 family protein [Roseburia sp.]MCM1347492.1 DUF4847 family protein [Bacteroides sp.]MCM1421974.1 DUF4847 family protein [Bacteroides sp.]
MNKFVTYLSAIIAISASLLLMTGCDNEDDIDELFIGKTWYIRGATFNGTRINGDDIKELYQVPNTYKISFSSGSFNGILVSGSSFRGIWTADGKSRSLQLNMQQQSGTEINRLSQQLFDVLNNTTRYGGDSNVMYIYKDNTNFILLSSEGNDKVYN